MTRQCFLSLIAGGALLSSAATCSATEVFSETFDDATSSASFTETAFTPSDVYVEYGFDYSATGSSRLTSSIGTPSGGGSASGVLVAANITGVAEDAGVNLYPVIGGPLPVDYKLSFDVWAGINNVNGTSEFIQAGARASGAQANIDAGDFNLRDGDWFELNAAGDLINDFITFTKKGGNQIAETFLGDGSPELSGAMPNPPYARAGAPGESWAHIEVTAIGGTTEFIINGSPVASVVGSDWTGGIPFLGYSDIFSSVAGGDSAKAADGVSDFDPFNASFAIFDNVTVTAIPEPTTTALMLLGTAGLALGYSRRR